MKTTDSQCQQQRPVVQDNTPKIQLEIDQATLARLFAQGHLCAAQINCLNLTSKQAVWHLCLQACGHCVEIQGGTEAKQSLTSSPLTGSWQHLTKIV